MSHGVKNFIWREGRPRWSPGPSRRAAGARSVDLKDESGEWLPLELALETANRLNARTEDAEVAQKRMVRNIKRRSVSYVYFFQTSRHVKIGFSNNPSRRAREFSTGAAEDLRVMVAVRGARAEETAIHQKFEQVHMRGEWFYTTSELLDFIGRCVALGDLKAALNETPTGTKNTKKRTCDVRRKTCD